MSILAIGTKEFRGAYRSIAKELKASSGNLRYDNSIPRVSVVTTSDCYRNANEVLKLSNAKKILNILNEKSKIGATNLSETDDSWLSTVRRYFGRNNFSVNNPDNPSEVLSVNSRLTVESVNNAENGFGNIQNALHTMVSSSKYNPAKTLLNGVEYNVHNNFVAKNIKSEYDSESLGKISKYLDDNRMFDLTDDPNYGFVIDKTSGLIKTCGASENWEMGDRMWVTDSMRVGDIQKYIRPETWPKSITTVSKFYEGQSSNFERIINQPSLYRDGGAMEGVPHIFLPRTLEGDPNWLNNKRLESAGLALKEISMAIVDGLVKGEKHGFQSADEIPDSVFKTVEYLSKYFKAIDYPTAPSAGNWEEIPLKGGLTWDTESVRSGFVALKDLAYNPKYATNPEIVKVRSRLNVDDEKTMTDLIKKGEERVRKTYLAEAPGIRESDSSLAFVTTSDIRLADNVLDDVSKHVEILEKLEKDLVKENGIIRYAPFNFKLKDGTVGHSPDSYLSLNYFNAVDNKGKINLKWKEILDKFGSKDASEPEIFNARAKMSTKDKEAQWFMVSEMSAGYGMQLEKLLNSIKDRMPNEKEAALIKQMKTKQTEFLNHALARISDENPTKVAQYKAKGLEMPRVTVPEAYQYVTGAKGDARILPGTNAPLSWALASLDKALKQQNLIIKMFE